MMAMTQVQRNSLLANILNNLEGDLEKLTQEQVLFKLLVVRELIRVLVLAAKGDQK